MRIGIGIGEISGTPATVDSLIEQAQRAERDGFASGWFANIFGFDAIMAAALCGRATTRIELGTAVVPTYPRHPTAMAQQAQLPPARRIQSRDEMAAHESGRAHDRKAGWHRAGAHARSPVRAPASTVQGAISRRRSSASSQRAQA